MERIKVSSQGAPAPVGAYSQALIFKDIVITSGQIGIDPGTGVIAGDAAAQTEKCLDNLEAVLSEAGSGLDGILRINLYITDMSDFDLINTVYGRRLDEPYPARSTIEVSALPKGALVEIDAIAVRRRSRP